VRSAVERGAEPGRAAELAAARWELSGEGRREVAELVRTLAASPLFRRSAAAARRLAETPVLYRDAAGYLVEGKIDLLFEEQDGFVVVDYKTDRDISRRLPEHQAQLADHAAALAALGLARPITAAYLLSARDGRAIEVALGR